MSFLLKSGQITDWDGIEKFWHKSIHSYLRCDPEEHRFILTEPPLNTPENREQMAEIMFETFKVPAINVAIPARLLLFVRVAEVVRRHEWPSPKSLDSDENVKP